jgi:trimeric autotransporter adhesin
MDHLRERLDALEHEVQTLHQQTQTAARQLRWWRGTACGLVVLSLLSLTFLSGKAADAQSGASANRLADLQDKLVALEGILRHVRVVTTPHGLKEVVITRANLRIVNGLGHTDCTDEEHAQEIPDCPNGLGNLIVGYNEPRGSEPDVRTGSHNVVVGQLHNFSRFGGIVVGNASTISGDFASVSGGNNNTASGFAAAVSGGAQNTASGLFSSVSGGESNTASGFAAAVSGGAQNTASGFAAAVSAGFFNTASGGFASVSGGRENTASGFNAAVSGGLNRMAPGDFDWVAGTLFEDE